VYLPLEGFEALRLADLEGRKHEEAAKKMNVSRQTFGRILSQARHSVAEALVHGFALRIDGGDFMIVDGNAQTAPVADRRQCASLADDWQRSSVLIEKKPQKKELQMEKIAVSAEGPDLDDALDPRFGRAAGFLMVNPQTLEHEYVDNGAAQAMAQGAGIQAAEIVARAGARVVLTGYVGPKAFQALQAAGIRIAQNLQNLTVREAIERYTSGKIEMATGPNRRGHGR
jgi:predicted Fe-Mo cluster-binding NifX family protein